MKRRDERATRRPAALISPSEIGIFLGVAAGFVVAGQLIWWLITGVEIDPTRQFPIQWVGEGRTVRRQEAFGIFPIRATIFFMLLGMLFFGTLLARLVFRYWQLRQMGPAEGSMILVDAGWAETKRERSRLERWRLWGRRRSEARAKAAAEEEELARVRARAAQARRERLQDERDERERAKSKPSRTRGTR